MRQSNSVAQMLVDNGTKNQDLHPLLASKLLMICLYLNYN